MASETVKVLRQRLRALEERLGESEEIVAALRSGEVDAIISSDPNGNRIYTLVGADAAYRAMVERMAEGALTVTEDDGLILFSNEQFATMAGTSLERVIGACFPDFIAPESVSLVLAMLAGGKGGRAEIRLKAGGAATSPAYLSAESLVLDGIRCLCVIVTDLSEQKRNDEIVAAERLARSILDQATEAIVVADANGRIIRASEAAQQLAGCPIALRGFDEVFRICSVSGADYPFREILSEVTRNRTIRNLEATVLTTDGRIVQILLSAGGFSSPGFSGSEFSGIATGDPGSVSLGCVLSMTDVTERNSSARRAAASEAHFRRLLDTSPVGIAQRNRAGQVAKSNDAFYRIIGWDRNAFVDGEMDVRKITPIEWRETTDEKIRASLESGRPIVYEKEFRRQDGSRVPVLVALSVIDTAPDDILYFVVDLTEQKNAEKRLLESERSLRSTADAMPQVVWTARPDGYVDYYNQVWYVLTGQKPGLSGDESWAQILHPEDRSGVSDGWSKSVSDGSIYQQQFRFWDRNAGEYRWYLGRALPLRDDLEQITKWVGTCTDIHEYKLLSRQLELRVEEGTRDLRKALAEKTTLLQEVHHRVKNNLQVVCSLLSTQISCLEGSSSLGPLKDAHSRVLAMSLIHEQIYQSETLAELDFGQYIQQLADGLYSAYCIDTSRIRLKLNVEAFHISVEQAIPCGLILNELLSNALKHGFSDGRTGVIEVALKKTGNDRVELLLSDNGKGLPPDFALGNTRSLGLLVVRSLIHQLRADLGITGTGGASFRLSWKLHGQEGPSA